MAEQKTPTSTRGWVTLAEFEVVAAGVFERAAREAVGQSEWDDTEAEEHS